MLQLSKSVIWVFSLALFPIVTFGGKPSLRVALADENFGNWHFCGPRENPKARCEPGDVAQGFNPDIAKEISRRMGLNFEIVFAEWVNDEFLEGLEKNKYDLIISNVGKKPARAKYGIFSNVPYEPMDEIDDSHFFVLKTREFRLGEVGVSSGTIQKDMLESWIQREKVRSIESNADLIAALVQGKVSAIFGSFSGLRNEICKHPEIVKFNAIPISVATDEMPDTSTYVLTAKREAAFASKLDQVLASMHADGTIRRIFDRWLIRETECEQAAGSVGRLKI